MERPRYPERHGEIQRDMERPGETRRDLETRRDMQRSRGTERPRETWKDPERHGLRGTRAERDTSVQRCATSPGDPGSPAVSEAQRPHFQMRTRGQQEK